MRVDYRTVITKKDIPVLRQALRESVFIYSQPESPSGAEKERGKFEKLLKKLNGVSVQRDLSFPRSRTPKGTA